MENFELLSADDGGNRTRAAVLFRFEDGVFVLDGLANPLLAGLESFELENELAVEGGVGRYLTPVEDGADGMLVLEDDEWGVVDEYEADGTAVGRGLFMLLFSTLVLSIGGQLPIFLSIGKRYAVVSCISKVFYRWYSFTLQHLPLLRYAKCFFSSFSLLDFRGAVAAHLSSQDSL